MPECRLLDLKRFYGLLDTLREHTWSGRQLASCSGKLDWPTRGVYFFMESGETRSHSGHGPRIVRVGTHGVKLGSKAKLWTRRSQHRGRSNPTVAIIATRFSV